MQRHKGMSLNAGVLSFSYCPHAFDSLVDQIDRLIAAEYGLPKNACSYVKEIMKRTIVAGRNDELESNPALSRWQWKEVGNEWCPNRR
jgi:hypothetical protein